MRLLKGAFSIFIGFSDSLSNRKNLSMYLFPPASGNTKSHRLLFPCCILAVVLTFHPYFARPLTAGDATEAGKPLTILPPVTVIGALNVDAEGKTTVDRDLIERMPQGNGSINELLRIVPDVRIDPSYRSSLTGGEILPPDLSISGGKLYDNYYAIDCLDNNSVLDPTTKNPNLYDDVPGHPQELFLNANLLDDITVYDSNIPARYGAFTGGVVDARTRSPGTAAEGRVFYRTTRDEWTSFHMEERDRRSFETEDNFRFQPNFVKHDGGVSIAFPWGNGWGALASAEAFTSTIPQRNLGEPRNQSRRLDNYFLKLTKDFLQGDGFAFTFAHTPYKGEYFIPDAKDSDFTIRGGGFLAAVSSHYPLSEGELDLKAAFRQSENTKDAPSHWRSWAASDSKDWGRTIDSPYSFEGGFGSIEKEQTGIEIQGDYRSDIIETGPVFHEGNIGFQSEWIQGSYERERTTYIFLHPRFNASVICGPDDFACVDGEQFFTFRNVYDPSTQKASIGIHTLYADDILRYNRFELRPGLRFSYNDFMKNADAAPRLSARLDLFGDRSTFLVAGLNRYYGRTLLTFKLREGRLPFRSETRSTWVNFPTAWEPSSFQGNNTTRFSRLDTPYTDEYLLGFDTGLLDGHLSLKFVERRGKDEFAKDYSDLQPDGLRYYTLTNMGHSRHRSWRISWERIWKNHYLSANANISESKSTNADYNDILGDTDSEERVFYQGAIVYKGELPEADTSPSLEVKMVYVARLPLGFRFASFARFLDSKSRIENTHIQRQIPVTQQRIDLETGQPIDEYLYVYDKVKNRSAVLFDWKISWERIVYKESLFRAILEINNVFNSRISLSNNADGYEVGRQYWAGIEYTF